ncbi:DUF4397 domain-containing protein [Pontibacter oryzae]|uniref:DUF4397 domain-containing protein n=1 Tax=Pontibacter oryzae TaxID=2304593 RepID=A0A399SFC9_9BACT|nr:DUF4397 domain-containing protein [Pontibacter oryzae]RIJ42340.1 DUF4397 domain-containing protein [Pontibacter oryzae]
MKNILFKSIAIVAAGLMLGSCEKNAIEDFNDPVNSGAYIKFLHAAPDAPAVNYYLDNTKVSTIAANSAGEEQGMAYAKSPLFPSNYGYANVEAGTRTLQAITPAPQGNAVTATNSVTLANGNFYSAFLIGSAGAYESLLVEDKLPAATYGKSYIRFVNLVQAAPNSYSATAVKTATSESPETRTAVGEALNFKGNTAYVAVEPTGSYVVELKENGLAGTVIKSSSFSPVGGRVYTLVMHGNYSGTKTIVIYRDR